MPAVREDELSREYTGGETADNESVMDSMRDESGNGYVDGDGTAAVYADGVGTSDSSAADAGTAYISADHVVTAAVSTDNSIDGGGTAGGDLDNTDAYGIGVNDRASADSTDNMDSAESAESMDDTASADGAGGEHSLSLAMREAIREAFEGTALRVYLSEILKRFRAPLEEEFHIRTVPELEVMLLPFWAGEYNRENGYLWVEEWGDDISGELLDYLDEQGRPVREEELDQVFWYLPSEVITGTLSGFSDVLHLPSGAFCLNDLLVKILGEIESALQSGASCIYLECLLARFRKPLAEQMDIRSLEALKAVLAPALSSSCILSPEEGLLYRRNPWSYLPSMAGDVSRVLSMETAPQSLPALRNRLWYLPTERWMQALSRDPSLVLVDPDTWFYAPNLPISGTELNALAEGMEAEGRRRGFLLVKDLRSLLQRRCPSAARHTDAFSDQGLGSCLSCLLRDRFAFSGQMIGPHGKPLDARDVFRHFCRESNRLTLDGLREFAKDAGAPVPWDIVLEEMVRISGTELVPKEEVYFDTAAIDAVLDRICKGEYLPLHDVKVFTQFPQIGMRWNGFILESYLLSDSKKFLLLQADELSPWDYYGMIVRADAPYESYQDVLTDFLAKSRKWTNAETAWRLILEHGCQTRKPGGWIDGILKAARVKRKRLEQEEEPSLDEMPPDSELPEEPEVSEPPEADEGKPSVFQELRKMLLRTLPHGSAQETEQSGQQRDGVV